MQPYHPRPQGHHERHLNTLAAMICGLVGSRRAQQPAMADHAPSQGARQESLIRRFKRWLHNEKHTLDGWFLPLAQDLLAAQAQAPLILVMDGTAWIILDSTGTNSIVLSFSSLGLNRQ